MVTFKENSNGAFDVIRKSTGEILATFDSRHLAKMMVCRINRALTQF